jgi:O-antigen ligase
MSVALILAVGLTALWMPTQRYFALLVLLTAGGVAFSPHRILKRVLIPLPVAAYFFWLTASFGWSTDLYGWRVGITATAPTFLAIFVVGAILGVQGLLRALVNGSYVVLLLQALAFISDRNTAMSVGQLPLGWRGSFDTKNGLGMGVGVALILIVCLESRLVVRVVFGGWAALLVAMSQSRTSQAAVVVALAVAVYCRLATTREGDGKRLTKLILPLGFVLPLAIFGSALLPVFLEAIGKDTSLTGRTEIWPAVLEMVAREPVTGYGYASTFRSGRLEPTRSIVSMVSFVPATTHSSALDFLLELGIVGLSIFLIFFVDIAGKAAKLGPSDVALRTATLSILTFTLITGFSESALGKLFLPLLALISQVHTMVQFANRKASRRVVNAQG